MLITTTVNQFLGINPLLHSRLQVEGGWDHFHVNHISDLTRFLQRDLRSMGYIALSEQSLQICERSHDDDEDLATYRAIGIYHKTDAGERGEAVAWLELLSPANKPGGRHFAAYRDKRAALLQAGLVFIELDYLHHQPPTIGVPIYPDAPDSSCYRIAIIDPRPEWLHGTGHVYPIQTDEPLPTLTIPLNAGDALTFDFDAPYQQTYEALFFGDGIDYARLPPAWERYRPSDQARILSRLLSIREHGIISPPRQIEPLSLSDALQRWEQNTR